LRIQIPFYYLDNHRITAKIPTGTAMYQYAMAIPARIKTAMAITPNKSIPVRVLPQHGHL
jgi:hypothetical protein